MKTRKPKQPLPEGVEAVPRRRRTRAQREAQTRTIGTLIRDDPSADELGEIDRDVNLAHPRSAAIMIAAEVERTLEFAILSRLVRSDVATVKLLVGRDGPLNGFYTKIHLAYAMGIIDIDQRHDLDIIRTVRNGFAHAFKAISFETYEIKAEIDKIKSIRDMDFTHLTGLAAALIGAPADAYRRKYIHACRTICSYLLTFALPS